MLGYKEKRKKKYGCLLTVLAVCLLSACGDDNDVTIPAVSTLQREEIPKSEEVETEDTTEKESGEASEAEKEVEKESETVEEGNESQETTDVENEADDEAEDKVEAEGEEAEAEPKPVVTSITISAAGDTTLGNYYEQGYAGSFDQTYEKLQDLSYFFKNVYDVLSQDDMTIVNLEGMLTNSDNLQPGRTFNIKGAPEYVGILTAGSVEAVSMENNHRLDYGEEGCRDTVEVLEEAGIAYAYGKNLGIYETQGIRIGIVSVNEASWGATVEKTLEEGITKLTEEQVDLIIASCHWGTEKDYNPEKYQHTLGQKCIDWGADLVIGHHPHVLQGIEEYQGKYIVHSLGNFCFGANRNPTDKDTMIFQQTFTFVDGVKQESKDIRVIPCSISSVTDRNDYCPTPAEGQEAQRIIEKINECSKDYGVAFGEDGLLMETTSQ